MTVFSSSGSVNISFGIENRCAKVPRTFEIGEEDRALGGRTGGVADGDSCEDVDFTGERRRRFVGFGGTGGAEKRRRTMKFHFVFH